MMSGLLKPTWVMNTMNLLNVNNINVYYGDVHILRDVSIGVDEKEIVSIVGGNGTGKTTFMKTLSGLLRTKTGSIVFRGQEIHNLPPYEITRQGISQVMEGRRLFPFMTVEDNLWMGAYPLNDREQIQKNFAEVLHLFPILKERKSQMARSFSGGEQQMLAIGRALMASPRLLMLDEPSLGLAPVMVNLIFDTLQKINAKEVTILLVEQDVKKSLSIASRGYVIEHGRVVMEGPGEQLLSNPHLRKTYLGI
jgi:branched-chain amino acid transport system ATP-binding protein